MTHTRSFSMASVSLFLLMLSGCAMWTKPMSTAEMPGANDAFFYGIFKSYSPHDPLGFDGSQTMGFVFMCSDGGKYTVRFREEQPLQVIKVKPATCSFSKIIYTNADGSIVREKAAPLGLMDSAVIAAGTAYYLGDFSSETSNMVAVFGGFTKWELVDASNSFDATTTAMRALYPNLTFTPTHDQNTMENVFGTHEKKAKPATYQTPVAP